MRLENNVAQFEPDIAEILAALCYHVHPEIVSFVKDRNAEDRIYFERLFGNHIPVNHYLFEGSACVFPGVRRYVNGRGRTKAFNPSEEAILDDNVFPRHLWCHLMAGKAYSGPAWKETGLNGFELAHVFSHKPATEDELEKCFFDDYDEGIVPFGNFTCAANVVLLPKGTVRPTDNSSLIKSVFYKRHMDLYGEGTLDGRSAFRHDDLPDWYDALRWNVPVKPPDWRANINRLLEYRKKTITRLIDKVGCDKSHPNSTLELSASHAGAN